MVVQWLGAPNTRLGQQTLGVLRARVQVSATCIAQGGSRVRAISRDAGKGYLPPHMY